MWNFHKCVGICMHMMPAKASICMCMAALSAHACAHIWRLAFIGTHTLMLPLCTHRCVLAWRLRFYSPWHFDCFSMLSGCSEKWLSDFLILNSIGIWMRFSISAFISTRNICVFQQLAIISFFVDSNMFGSNLISCNCGARHLIAGFRFDYFSLQLQYLFAFIGQTTIAFVGNAN